MPAKTATAPSISRIRTFEVAARQITDGALPPGLADRINAVVAEVNALADAAPSIADHQPIWLARSLFPGAMRQVGCTCGHAPKTPNRRSSTMFNSYNTHLTRLGLRRPLYNVEPLPERV